MGISTSGLVEEGASLGFGDGSRGARDVENCGAAGRNNLGGEKRRRSEDARRFANRSICECRVSD